MKRMTGYDAAFLYDERPEEPQHTLKVSIWSPEASSHYSLEATRRFVRSRLPQLPPLRWRALRVPFDLYHPVWVEDPALDLRFHVRSRAVPPPAGKRELCQEISRIASRPLDPQRPLWELWMLEGYRGDRVVAVLKMSHALADGVASRELLARLYSATPIDAGTFGTPEDEHDGDFPACTGEPLPSRWTLIRDALRDGTHGTFYELPRLGRVTRAVLRSARHSPDPIVYRGPRISLLSSPRTPFAGPPGGRRSFSFSTVRLDEAKEIGRSQGCTVNDVVLATAAGAVRAFLEARQALPALPTLAHMPACIRSEEEREAWGNRITSRPISLPTHIADPVQRLRAASEIALEAKQDLSRRRGANLEDWLCWLPPVACKGVGQAARLLVRLRPDLPGGVTVSSVPGPRQALHAPGGPVENFISVGHVKYVAGLNITAWSYAGNLNFGLYACPESVPDASLLADLVLGSFDELRMATTRRAASIGP